MSKFELNWIVATSKWGSRLKDDSKPISNEILLEVDLFTLCGNLIHINVVSPHFPPSVAHTRICSLKLDPLLFIFVAFFFFFFLQQIKNQNFFPFTIRLFIFLMKFSINLGTQDSEGFSSSQNENFWTRKR